MSEQPSLTPEILPPQETPEMYGPVKEAQPMQSPHVSANPLDIIKKFTPFIAIFFILLIVLLVSSLFSQKTPTISQTITMTPTPSTSSQVVSSKTLNTFATTSAFMQFDSTIESLPNIIQQAVLQDPTAMPPVMDLPLGFSN